MGFEMEMEDIIDQQPSVQGGTVHVDLDSGTQIAAEVYRSYEGEQGTHTFTIRNPRIDGTGKPFQVTSEIRDLLIAAFHREYVDKRKIGGIL